MMSTILSRNQVQLDSEKRPKHLKPSMDFVMTNFDHSIDKSVAARLKKEPVFAQYAAWEFCGNVWWDSSEKLWKCEIGRYHLHVNTLKAKTLRGIMKQACEQYGDA